MSEQVMENMLEVVAQEAEAAVAKNPRGGGWWLDESRRAQHIAAMKAGWARKRNRLAKAQERKRAMEEAQASPLRAIEERIAYHQQCLETLTAAKALLQKGA